MNGPIRSGILRVRVVGNSGAGKTTFARRVAARLGVAYRELDDVFWDEGWTQRAPDDGQEILREFLAGPGRDGWVVDGNWNSRIGDVLAGADAVVWLDYPRRVVMPRVVWRTVARGITRRELWHGNRERLGNLLRRDPQENIVAWAWTQHDAYREQYAALARSDPRVIRVTSPRAARRWLDNLT